MSLQSHWIEWRYWITRRAIKKFGTAESHRHFIEFERSKQETPIPDSLRRLGELKEETIDGHTVYTLKVEGSKAHVFYLHGGAYTNVILPEHWAMLESLVRQTGCSLTVPLYGLAPEFNFKHAYKLVLPLYRRLCADVGADQIVMAGDSAGGGLTLALAQELKKQNLPQPAQIVLFCPWLDITMTNPETKAFERVDPMLRIDGTREAGRLWAAGSDPRDPNLSPMYGDSTGLAPITIFIGTKDILLPDIRKFVQMAQKLKIPLTYHEVSGMIHVWMIFPTPEARAVVKTVAGIIKGH